MRFYSTCLCENFVKKSIISEYLNLNKEYSILVLDPKESNFNINKKFNIKKIETDGDLEEYRKITSIFNSNPIYFDELKERLTKTKEISLMRYLGYSDDNIPVSIGELHIQNINNEKFASLWGGFVLPKYRNQGFAMALAAYRIREAIDHGCMKILTAMDKDNHTHYCKKLGFQDCYSFIVHDVPHLGSEGVKIERTLFCKDSLKDDIFTI